MPSLFRHLSIVLVFCCYQLNWAEEPLTSLQKHIDTVLRENSPAVVSIWYGEPERHITGTCVSSTGLIITCGHLKREVGDEVEVRFTGRKPVAAKVIAKHKTLDVALIQTAGKESWPAVALGGSKNLSLDDPLLALGFGNTSLFGSSAKPLILYVRLGYRKEQRLWPKADELKTTVYSKGGDSGGPLFDMTGGLVGICSNGELDGSDTCYVAIDAVLREWGVFAKEVPLPAVTSKRRTPLPHVATVLQKAIGVIQPAVAEVQIDDRWVGIATHIGRGLFLTKASELRSPITLILSDGTVAQARVAARDTATDLALLQLVSLELGDKLPEVRWAEEKAPTEGRLLAAVTPGAFSPPVGAVCVSTQKVPAIPGILPVRVKDPKDGKRGVMIDIIFAEMTTPWLRPPGFPLMVGDRITEIAGLPIPDSESFRKWTFGEGKEIGGHPRVAGEAIEVKWMRGDKEMKALVHLRLQQTAASQRIRPYSYRYSGFAGVFACDFFVRPEHCGAPVVDAAGNVVGLVIAKAPFIECLVLPTQEVRAATERMMKMVGKR
ncbi:MAG: trypsin-like peptidase domain-containing protein [Gemmatales bacterium]